MSLRLPIFAGTGSTPPAPPGSAYDAAVLADTPIIYLPCNEPSGTTATDATGNGHNGTYTGGCTLAQTGPCSDGETAVLLDGSSGYVSVPTHAALNLTPPFSIEMWVKFTDYATYYIPIAKNGLASGYCIYEHTGAAGQWIVTLNGNSGAGETTAPAAGTWVYRAVTDDGSGNIQFYLNGATNSSGLIDATVPTANTDPLFFGHRSDGFWLKGAMAKLALYDHKLTSGHVSAHYAAR